jgi:hypothetical protein
MKFGLVCEGITDYIIIKKILRGYFPKINPTIRQLQPALDETDEKQIKEGGWEKIITYLQSTDFYDALETLDFIIIQIDTDDAEHKNYAVSVYDENHKDISPEKIIENVRIKLISIINKEELYENYADKIIFAICVHSLECWLHNYYNFLKLQKDKKELKSPKITNCGKGLNHILNETGFVKPKKDKELYKKYSEDFLEKRNIELLAKKDPSFKIFIQQLLISL